MLNYRHLFFDLDRTLWDYDRNASQALTEVYEKYNLQPVCNNFTNFWNAFNKFNNLLWKDYLDGSLTKNELRNKRFELILLEHSVNDPELAMRMNEDFLDSCPRKTNLIEGALDLLTYLKEKGYHLYIITNGFTHIQEIKLITSGLRPFFLKVYTSDKSGYVKPQRAMFENAVKSVNARKKESLMIGDDLTIDIIGARTFGMDQVYYNPLNLSHTEKVTYEIAALQEMKLFL